MAKSKTNNKAFSEIMRAYDRMRQDGLYIKEKRTEEVRRKIPRIAEIEEEMGRMGVALAKAILDQAAPEAGIQELQQKGEALAAEKSHLMEAHGFPPDYLTDIYTCPICRDTGYVGERKCACLAQKLIDVYYEQSNLKDIVAVENFDTFDLRYYSEEPDPAEGIAPRDLIKLHYQTCIDFAANFGRNFINLLFYGKPGLGKTFLCNCIAKDLLDAGKTVLYVTSNQLFKTIEDYRFNRDEMIEPSEQVGLFYTVDLLIIDDLGTELSTMITQSELYNIINSRILEKRPTIISSNLMLKDFEATYSDRIVSRLMGEYKSCKFIGEDIRLLKKYAFMSEKGQ